MAAPTEQAILKRVGSRSFERGLRYFREGNVHAARRQGNVLKARCYGSDDNDYRIEVHLEGTSIVWARCTCPAGARGMCKHVAALLLNWRERPQEFEQSEDVEAALAHCSKPELIELIRALLDADPELDEVVESALPPLRESASISRAAVRQSIARAIERAARDETRNGTLAAAIGAQRAHAVRRLKAGDVQNAVAIIRGVLAAVTAHYDPRFDPGGEVAHAVHRLIALLDDCFARLDHEDSLRIELLQELLSLLRFDVGLGGIALADEVPELIARHATAAERRKVVEWIRSFPAPARKTDVLEAWRRECWGALIADLVGDEMDDEEYLAHCLEYGLSAARIGRLLQLGRIVEAQAAAAALDDDQRPEAVELFLKYGREAEALALMQSRAAHSPAAAAWLMDYYEERQRWDAALQWRLHEFARQPDLFHYRAARRVARKAGRWPEVREQLLAEAARSTDVASRLRILLEEERIDEAFDVLDRLPSHRSVDDVLLEEIAHAAAQSHPQRAIALYQQLVEGLLRSRRAARYAAATDLLRQARDISHATGRSADWDEYLSALAARTSRLRAFRQQLRASKLLP